MRGLRRRIRQKNKKVTANGVNSNIKSFRSVTGMLQTFFIPAGVKYPVAWGETNHGTSRAAGDEKHWDVYWINAFMAAVTYLCFGWRR